MAVEKITVERTEAGFLQGRPGQAAHCAGCGARAGCGLRLLHQGQRALRLPAPSHVQPGDTVTVAMADRHLVMLSFLLYLLPLAFMLAAVLLADAADIGEGVVVLSALAGLVTGLVLVRQGIDRLAGNGERLLAISASGDD